MFSPFLFFLFLCVLRVTSVLSVCFCVNMTRLKAKSLKAHIFDIYCSCHVNNHSPVCHLKSSFNNIIKSLVEIKPASLLHRNMYLIKLFLKGVHPIRSNIQHTQQRNVGTLLTFSSRERQVAIKTCSKQPAVCFHELGLLSEESSLIGRHYQIK